MIILSEKSVLLEILSDERENLASNPGSEIVGFLNRRGTDSGPAFLKSMSRGSALRAFFPAAFNQLHHDRIGDELRTVIIFRPSNCFIAQLIKCRAQFIR